MHRSILTAAVILAVLLLGIDVGLQIGEATRPNAAQAQAASRTPIIAAAGIQNDAFCFLYDPTTRQLVSYQQRVNSGLQLRAIRTCKDDFNAQILEYPKTNSPTAVRKMKTVARSLATPPSSPQTNAQANPPKKK